MDQPPSNWTGPKGYVNADVVRDALKEFGTTPDKGDKVKVFVCGPPGQVKAISGPKKVRDLVVVVSLSSPARDLGWSKLMTQFLTWPMLPSFRHSPLLRSR